MASNNNPAVVNASATTTTADIAILTQPWDRVRISNRHATVELWAVFNTTTAPTAAQAGSHLIPAASNRVFKLPVQGGGVPGNTTAATACHVIGLVGNANPYSVEGLAGRDE